MQVELYRTRSGSAAPISFEAEPSEVTIAPGGTARAFVSAYYVRGFSSTNTKLWVRGLPSGIDARFAPQPLTHQGMSALFFTADKQVEAGRYRLTVGATAGDATRSAQLAMSVTDRPDFGLRVFPQMQYVGRGAQAVYPITVDPLNGFRRPVWLTAAGLPDGAAATFRPNPVLPGRQSRLIVDSPESGSGSFPIAVTGRAGTLTTAATGLLRTAVGGGGSWKVRSIADIGQSVNTVLLGPGRDDGVPRLYAGTIDGGRVYEMSRSGSGWGNAVDIGGSTGGSEIHHMGMGAGRDDGVTRIYACSVDGALYELTFTDPDWSQNTVGPEHDRCFHALVGKGRNDGVNRVYAARGSAVYEYTRSDGQWNERQVGTVGGLAHGIGLGRGRGGRKLRLYVASTQNGTYEATFRDGAWQMHRLGDDGDIRNVSVGRGRDGGKMRVYAANTSGRIREFTWRGGRWRSTTINEPLGGVMVHAFVVDGRNNGVGRVYGAAANGRAYEFTWTGSRWRARSLGGANQYLYGFHFGRPAGREKTRLFGGSFDGHVYQFTWKRS